MPDGQLKFMPPPACPLLTKLLRSRTLSSAALHRLLPRRAAISHFTQPPPSHLPFIAYPFPPKPPKPQPGMATATTTPPSPPRSVYMRELPVSADLILYDSPGGKAVFRSALEEGGLEAFFPLSQQFLTQEEPACMVYPPP